MYSIEAQQNGLSMGGRRMLLRREFSSRMVLQENMRSKADSE
jgi:hypothetical protein